jgi:hypothetical protein
VYKTAKVSLRIGVFAFGLGLFSMASGDGLEKGIDSEVIPTNFELLRLVVEEAIEEVCDRLPSHETKLLHLGSESDAPGNWLVERALIQSLRRRSYRVMAPDTSCAQPNMASAGRELLRYRLMDLNLLYPASRRKHLFGSRLVERQVRLHLLLQLNREDGEVLWTGETKRTGGDWISVKKLEYAEQESPPFISPQLKADGWSRFAEPTLLSVVIGGLIYLFYSTQ